MDTQVKEEEQEETSKGERIKRDEWSDGAVDCLLESYEAKWILRNRAKLKGHDWEDVARQVSSRENSDPTKGSTTKTATQCKNKIESMKKRYRNEVAAGSGGSRWPLFSKLDGLVRCRGAAAAPATITNTLVIVDEKPSAVQTLLSQPAELNGLTVVAETAAKENHTEVKNATQPTEMNKEVNAVASQSSSKEKRETLMKSKREKRKRENEEGDGIVESMQRLGEIMLRVEQTRTEGMKEVEKIRAEIEARKGEMDLKRTEIIANTQLEIARLFLRKSKGKVNSSTAFNRKD